MASKEAPENFVFPRSPRRQSPAGIVNWVSEILRAIDRSLRLVAIRANASVKMQGYTTPDTLTADVNDYNPSNLNGWRLSSDASRDITGIANGQAGRILFITNVGANNIRLANEGTGSLAENRIITGTGTFETIDPAGTAILIYDEQSERWRIVSVK